MELKLGTVIKKLRTTRGITQEELANNMGVSFQAVSKWETNTTTPDISILPSLALYFGVSIDELFSMNNDDYIKKINNMIRDEYSISPENFIWAERYLKGLLVEDDLNNTARVFLVELYAHRQNRISLEMAKICEEGVAIDPSDEALLGSLVKLRKKREDIKQLIEFLEKTNRNTPCCDNVVDTLISVYIEQGLYDLALGLINSSKNKPMFEIYKGDIEFSKGNSDVSKAIWNAVASNNSDDSHILFEVAERFRKVSDSEIALEFYKKSYDVAHTPKEMDPLYAQAFLYTELGMKDKAVRTWERIIQSLEDDYGIKSGECVDWPKREIQKLL